MYNTLLYDTLEIETFILWIAMWILSIWFVISSSLAGSMMTSSNGNIFHVTGPLWGETTGDRYIPLTKFSCSELWCFLYSAPEHTVKQTIETPVTWDAIALNMTSLYWISLYNSYDDVFKCVNAFLKKGFCFFSSICLLQYSRLFDMFHHITQFCVRHGNCKGGTSDMLWTKIICPDWCTRSAYIPCFFFCIQRE